MSYKNTEENAKFWNENVVPVLDKIFWGKLSLEEGIKELLELTKIAPSSRGYEVDDAKRQLIIHIRMLMNLGMLFFALQKFELDFSQHYYDAMFSLSGIVLNKKDMIDKIREHIKKLERVLEILEKY